MTVRIGLAMLRDGDAGTEPLLVRADAMFCAAKRARRNHVVVDAERIAAWGVTAAAAPSGVPVGLLFAVVQQAAGYLALRAVDIAEVRTS